MSLMYLGHPHGMELREQPNHTDRSTGNSVVEDETNHTTYPAIHIHAYQYKHTGIVY